MPILVYNSNDQDYKAHHKLRLADLPAPDPLIIKEETA
jgi:hypothetical protein